MIDCDAIMRWMDLHPSFYFYLAGATITGALISAVNPLLREQTEEKPGGDWGWGLWVVAILAAGRWPSIFFPRELNSDESQLLAGARALLYDPVFWRSVNGGTAGPLDFFALWPAGWIFGWQSYLAARFTALAFLAISLVVAHQCVALVFGRKVARVAILAAVCLEALTNAVDLLHYSTELLAMMLLAVAAYAAIRRWVNQGVPLWNGLGGLLLGAVPLAKLQAVPMAAAMGLGWLIAEASSKEPNAPRRITYLLTGAFLPVTLFVFQLTIAGDLNDAIIAYFFCNLHYSGNGLSSLRQLALDSLEQFTQRDSLMQFWLFGSLVWLLLVLRPRRIADPTARAFTLASIAAFLLALFCIIFPRRPFLHYWQLAIVPGGLLLGTMTGNLLATSPTSWRRRERWLVAACLIGLVGTLLVHRARNPNYFIKSRTYFNQNSRSILASRIRAHVHPEDSVAIWGWSNYVYVEAGLRQATREPVFGGSIEAGPYRAYCRERFLADLAKAKPTFFLDSVGPCSLIYQSPEFAHDRNFPELAAVIRAEYVQVDEVLGARLYRRRDASAR
jgi:hypothetical protein